MELVGEVVGHLRRQTRASARGVDVQGIVFASERQFPTGVVADGDLAGSIAVDVRTHGPSPIWFSLRLGTLRRPSYAPT